MCTTAQPGPASARMALGVIMAVTGEALAMGVAHGLHPSVLSQMMAVSTGRSWATEVCNP